MTTNIATLVRAVQHTTPLPDSYADLDKASQRHLARESTRLGVTPEQHYANLCAATAADVSDADEIAAILAAIRR